MILKRRSAGLTGLVAACAVLGLLAAVGHGHGLPEAPSASPAVDADGHETAAASVVCPACALARTAIAEAVAPPGPEDPRPASDTLPARDLALPEAQVSLPHASRAPPALV